ncbi:MAG: porphobilinogen synthase [Pyramidobacter sp.]|jgi:porphobilinogen synthase
MIVRPRRLRVSPAIRNMVAETRLSPDMFIYPVFIREGKNIVEDIPSLPGQKRYSPDTFPRVLEEMTQSGVGSVLLFGLPEHKDAKGTGAWADDGVIQQALRIGKKEFPHVTFIGDVCMCEYTSHGHCGILHGTEVDNDETLEYLTRIAVSQAAAGADIVAPSDMMDGHVAAIRAGLDAAGMKNKIIFSYAVKYASAFYGPFRDAAGSAPAFGDRRAYQMDPRNAREGLKEAMLDIDEGADMVMVKPGLLYMDVLRAVKEACSVPVGTYCVSGEYAMIKAAAANGWLDEKRAVSEAMYCLARAGADVIITYSAMDVARWLREGSIAF